MKSKIEKLLKYGWTIDQVQLSAGWYYLGARHDSGEGSVTGAGETLSDAFDALYSSALAATPQWFISQLHTA